MTRGQAVEAGLKTCRGCGRLFPLEEMARRSALVSGRKNICRGCDRARSRAYYAANREAILARSAAKRAATRLAPVQLYCTECPNKLTGRQKLVCSSRCTDRRYKRLHPESYAERERWKVVRRRARRREQRGAS